MDLATQTLSIMTKYFTSSTIFYETRTMNTTSIRIIENGCSTFFETEKFRFFSYTTGFPFIIRNEFFNFADVWCTLLIVSVKLKKLSIHNVCSTNNLFVNKSSQTKRCSVNVFFWSIISRSDSQRAYVVSAQIQHVVTVILPSIMRMLHLFS